MASTIPRSSRLKKNINRFFILICCFWTTAAALSLSESQQVLSRTVVDYILNNEYDEAFKKLAAETNTNGDPLSALLKLATIGMRDVDYEKTVDSSLFLSTYEKTSQLVDVWEKKHGVSSYSRMLAGMCRAMHATFYLRQKKYFGAMQHGLDAIKMMKEAQELDSSNVEVDFFLGLYEYARAELRSRLWWVLFWYGGDRKHGIQRIARCAKNGVITGKAARLSLCDINLKEKQPDQSKRNIVILKKQYPESRFVLWAEVKYFEEEALYTEAANAYHHLSQQYAAVSEHGTYNELFSLSKMAEMLCKAGEKQRAESVCEKVLHHKKIAGFKKIEKQTKKLLEHCNAS